MIRFFTLPVLFALTLGTTAFAGALYVEVTSPANNSEAASMHALAVARTTACVNPGKSMVTATVIELVDGSERKPLRVVPLATPGAFALVGSLPQGNAVIDVIATNPDYKNYQVHAYVRTAGSAIEWASVKRVFGAPASDADLRAMFSTQ